MTHFNELCENVKVNRQAYPQFDEDYLKATKQEHKVEQCNMTKPRLLLFTMI